MTTQPVRTGTRWDHSPEVMSLTRKYALGSPLQTSWFVLNGVTLAPGRPETAASARASR